MTHIPPPGTTVEINMASPWDQKDNPEWEDCVVVELLNTQFTYERKDGRIGYCFYAHYGETWMEATV